MSEYVRWIVADIALLASVAFAFYQKGRSDGFNKDGLPIIEWYRCANRQLWDRLYAKGEM